ncbi:hypothetical protein [Paramaledivibacter caminithermalis]|jgi:hypothetical protein|nr:hypothetical protein [Paramaledivibacter caminithermalis]
MKEAVIIKKYVLLVNTLEKEVDSSVDSHREVAGKMEMVETAEIKVIILEELEEMEQVVEARWKKKVVEVVRVIAVEDDKEVMIKRSLIMKRYLLPKVLI